MGLADHRHLSRGENTGAPISVARYRNCDNGLFYGRIPTQKVEQEATAAAHSRPARGKGWPVGFCHLDSEAGLLELHISQQGPAVDGANESGRGQTKTGRLSVALDYATICRTHQAPILKLSTVIARWDRTAGRLIGTGVAAFRRFRRTAHEKITCLHLAMGAGRCYWRCRWRLIITDSLTRESDCWGRQPLA
jgi:hypothetical protein